MKNTTLSINRQYVWVLCALGLTLPQCLFASTITNNVIVTSSSSSRDNASASVQVRSIVNGQVVENYQEESVNGEIKYSSTINVDGVNTDIVASTTKQSIESLDREGLLNLISLLEQLISRLTGVVSR